MSNDSAARAQLRQLEKQFYAQFDLPDNHNTSTDLENETNDELDSSLNGSEDDEQQQQQLRKKAKHTGEPPSSSGEMDDTEEEGDDSDEDSECESEISNNNESEISNNNESEISNNNDLDDEEDLLQKAMQPSVPKTTKSIQPRRAVETVVFQDTPRTSSAQSGSGEARKNFMVRLEQLIQSSKIERINAQDSAKAEEELHGDADEEEDMRANDRKLADLLSTSLFAPGSGKDKRKLTSTTNETLARIHELSTSDTLQPHAAGSGWGEKQLRAKELGKMPARIRTGLRRAAGERRDREIETQKELGLWNPRYQSQAQLNRGSATERGTRANEPKKRMRGIGSGVGSFRNGTLHLSQADVRRIQGPKRGSSKRRPPK